QDAEIATASQKLDKLSSDIRMLKSRHRTQPALLRDYRLQSLLQAAQRVSEQLQKMSDARKTKQNELRQSREALAAALDHETDALRDVANSHLNPTDQRRAAATQIEKLSWERMHLSLEREAEPLPANASNLL